MQIHVTNCQENRIDVTTRDYFAKNNKPDLKHVSNTYSYRAFFDDSNIELNGSIILPSIVTGNKKIHKQIKEHITKIISDDFKS